jgi:hypothetical protein
MKYWSFCIASSEDEIDPPSGYVIADSEIEALRIINHIDANVYQLPADFIPPKGDGPIIWMNRKQHR